MIQFNRRSLVTLKTIQPTHGAIFALLCRILRKKGAAMKFDETKLYVLDGRGLNYIASLMQRLYDSEAIGCDESRNLADGLNAHLKAADRYYPQNSQPYNGAETEEIRSLLAPGK